MDGGAKGEGMASDKVREKLGDAIGAVAGRAKEYGGKALVAAKEGSQLAAEKAQETSWEVRKKLYNPVFPEDYSALDFDLPKMIVIVDEDERKGIDVCEGAIGWLSKQAGLEVFHLYEEAVPLSGLRFYPMVSCDSVYYRDKFDGKRFVNIACYLETIQSDKITELKQIAYKLGAKRCRLETYEEAKTVKLKKRQVAGKVHGRAYGGAAEAGGSFEESRKESQFQKREVVFAQTFEGNMAPQRPNLRWFAHDNEIASLIDTRCSESGGNVTREYSFKIDSSVNAVISESMAGKIDAALSKMGAKCNFSLKGEVESESRKKMVFEIEF